MSHPPDPVDLRCNFCGRLESDGRTMVAGPGIYICNECVDLAVEVLEKGKNAEEPENHRPGSR